MRAFIIISLILAGSGLFYLFSRESREEGPRVATAISESVDKMLTDDLISSEEADFLKVKFAIDDITTSKGELPESLYELIPDYFNSIPNDPETEKPFRYKKLKNAFELGSSLIASPLGGKMDVEPRLSTFASKTKGGETDDLANIFDSDQEFINPNTMVTENFIYSTEDKRDPFLPFDMAKKVSDSDADADPLLAYDLGQLKVTAILASVDQNFIALIEDSQGIGYSIKVGSRIGNAGGEVVQITETEVKIIESYQDFTGKKVSKPSSLKLYRGES